MLHFLLNSIPCTAEQVGLFPLRKWHAKNENIVLALNKLNQFHVPVNELVPNELVPLGRATVGD